MHTKFKNKTIWHLKAELKDNKSCTDCKKLQLSNLETGKFDKKNAF